MKNAFNIFSYRIPDVIKTLGISSLAFKFARPFAWFGMRERALYNFVSLYNYYSSGGDFIYKNICLLMKRTFRIFSLVATLTLICSQLHFIGDRVRGEVGSHANRSGIPLWIHLEPNYKKKCIKLYVLTC